MRVAFDRGVVEGSIPVGLYMNKHDVLPKYKST